MKRFFIPVLCFALLLSLGLYFSSGIAAQQGGAYSNPLQGNISVADAGTCSTTNSFVWQHLPSTAGVTTLNLAGTFTATVTVRESNNGGATWATVTTLTTTGTTTYGTNGFTDFCADVTAFTSGPVQISITTGTQAAVVGAGSALGGANAQLLFNSNGAIGGVTGLTYSTTNKNLAFATQAGVIQPYFIVTDGNFGGDTNFSVTGAGAVQVGSTSSSRAALTIGGTGGGTLVIGPNACTSASPAVCGAAASGAVAVAAAATTEVVNTTAITANSQVQLTFDSSLGAKLSVTCNTTITQGTVSARTAGTSFTITVAAAPVTNPACFSFTIIN